MRCSWLREPAKYFVAYTIAGVAILPCAIVFAALKRAGYHSLLILPISVGLLLGLALVAWFEHRARSSAPAVGPVFLAKVTSSSEYRLAVAGMGPFPAPAKLDRDSLIVRWIHRLSLRPGFSS